MSYDSWVSKVFFVDFREGLRRDLDGPGSQEEVEEEGAWRRRRGGLWSSKGII